MSSVFRRYILPLLVLMLGALLIRIEYVLFSGSIENTLVIVTQALVMFGFGITLNAFRKRKNEGWILKIIISFLLLFFIFWDLGIIVFPELKSFFETIGFTGFVVHCFYVYLGYSFFD